MRKQHSIFFIFKNESFSVITKPKVASRTMTELFRSNYNPYIYLDESGTSYMYENLIEHNMYNEFINNSTNNKLHILYRNPQKRYYSGIIEDLIRVIDSNTIKNMYYLNSLFKKHFINPFKFEEDIKSNNYNFLLSNEQYVNFVKDLITEWIEWQLSYKPIISDHTEPYIDILYNLSNRNVNESVLVNIDNTLNSLENIFLKNLNSEISENLNNHQIHTSHINFYKLVDDVFNKKEEYLHFKEGVLRSDNMYYNIFEASEKNILNKK
jgi:hypothetical protein